MHVLVNVNALGPVGGVEQSTLQVSRGLAERGHQVSVLYRRGGENAEEWRDVATDLRQVSSFDCAGVRAPLDLLRLAPAVRAAARWKPDAIWLNRAEQLVWGAAASRAAGCPLVVHVRTHLPVPFLPVVGRAGDEYLAVSDFVRERWIASGLPAERITTLHNGIDPAAYPEGGLHERAEARAELGLPAEGRVVLSYGRQDPAKGVDLLLEAWRTMPGRRPEDRLVLAGDPGPRHGGYVDALKVSAPDGVVWLPSRADVVPLLHAADVVALPARWQEAFGRVVVEAMSTGRPVVASAVGGVPEILTGEHSAGLCAPGSVADLAARVAGLLDWRQEDPGLGARARRHVADHFGLDRVVTGVEGALQRAVAARATAATVPAAVTSDGVPA
ncbi:glycosyltransferase family 4 protein [Nocardioides bruguierae]|uniref:Glycosyltransferase family 4 protein n=1 Tax=Nocardioides bruguierae TaxID=2945102 RepID=A0A9X2D8W1_9ACTN|nr:glycosyltransferase family 4 protein [Nocardioides bruguierae]MCL8026148.1 glycosyltransferase family 4 protein [Nocardioides bruguierae]MCM0621491.1 glycosyltransferase family 4 protein [Nocardioides bruguierae]